MSLPQHFSTHWIGQTAVVRHLGIDERYLRVARYRHRQGSESWKSIKVGSEYYYEIKTIPNYGDIAYRAQATAVNPDQRQTTAKLVYAVALEGAKSFIEIYQKKTQIHYKQTYLYKVAECAELAKSSLFIEYVYNLKDSHKIGDLLTFAETAAVELNLQYLPISAGRIGGLLRMRRRMPNMLYLQKRRLNNQNAKIEDNREEIMQNLLHYRASGANYTNAHIARQVHAELQAKYSDKKIPTQKTLEAWLATHEIQWLTNGERHGSNGKFHVNQHKPYIPMSRAKYAGDCWQMDATRINMLPVKTENGELKYLYVVVVSDVMSGDILGVSICYQEDRWNYIHALRQAVKETGYLPYELRYDRFPGHNTQDFKRLEQLMDEKGVKMTCTHKSTGKGHLERWFSTMQQVFLQQSDKYYGEGIKSINPYAHRSNDWLYNATKIAKKEGWDYHKGYRHYIGILEQYKYTPLSHYSRKYKHIEASPVELRRSNTSPDVYSLTQLDFVQMFGIFRDRLTIKNGMIVVEVAKIKYHYRITDPNILLKYKCISACIDLENMDKIYIFEQSKDPEALYGKYIGEVAFTPEVQGFGKDADVRELGKQKAEIAQVETARKEILSQLLGETEPKTPQITTAGEAEVLTYHGQTKEALERAEDELIKESYSDNIFDYL